MISKHAKLCLTLLTLMLLISACTPSQKSGPTSPPETSLPQPPPSSPAPAPAPAPPPPVVELVVLPPNGGTEWVNADVISELDLRLLLTDFYAPELWQQMGYGYYMYLVFADRTASSRAKRLKAAEAFICSFSSAAGADVQQLPKETIALFLAPLVSSQDVTSMHQS
ncbi:MAG: hypothetical protein ACI8Z9_002281, partial [Paraglaciecola sp.]